MSSSKSMLKKLIISASLSASVIMAPSLVSAEERDSPRSTALKCSILYEMMMTKEPAHEKSNIMLNDQSMVMGTIFSILSESQGKSLSADEFASMRLMVEENFISQYKSNSDNVVDQLVQCEGWREDVIMHLVSQSSSAQSEGEASQEDILKIFADVPQPKAQYPIKGVNRVDVALTVEKAFSQHVK